MSITLCLLSLFLFTSIPAEAQLGNLVRNVKKSVKNQTEKVEEAVGKKVNGDLDQQNDDTRIPVK